MTEQEFNEAKERTVELAKTYSELGGEPKWITSVEQCENINDLQQWGRILKKAILATSNFNQNFEGMFISVDSKGKPKIEFIPKPEKTKKKPIFWLCTIPLLIITLPISLSIFLLVSGYFTGKKALADYSHWLRKKGFKTPPEPKELPPHIKAVVDQAMAKLFPHNR